MEQITDPHHKCLAINLDNRKYGTIAEIGAGQETARWFFKVGGAAGTIAKAISAYDMTFSDAIYGTAPRYVCRERLDAMLTHEYDLIIERLTEQRGTESTFFAFANTVAARSYSRSEDGQGWVGVKFQDEPGRPPSTISLHVHLTGRKSMQDQSTLGVLGVNLIYAAFYYHHDPELLLKSLMDDLQGNMLEIDMVDFDGPAFADVDNRLMALRLVEYGMTPGAMFNADGRVVHPADLLYHKAVLVERSRFRPPTLLTMDMLDCAERFFVEQHGIANDDLIVISEMTLNNLREGDEIDSVDFLQRADILCALGKHVLVSNMGEYYRLAAYIFRATQRPMAIALGIPTLREIFDERYYEDLPGGILEAFGRLFRYDLRLYVAPALEADGSLCTTDNFCAPKHLRHLYLYLYENGFINALNSVNTDYLSIHSDQIINEIRCCSDEWRQKVPPLVRDLICSRGLFGSPVDSVGAL